MEPNIDWKKGDLVTLKSGGPLMTVDAIDEEEGILSQWFDKTKLQVGWFEPETLNKGELPRAKDR